MGPYAHGPPGNCPACPCVNAGLCLPWQKEKSLLKILLLVFGFFFSFNVLLTASSVEYEQYRIYIVDIW